MKKSMKFYDFATSALSGLLKVLFRVKIIGNRDQRELSSGIICANHMSNWDPVILACSLKCSVSFMAKDELFKIPVLRGLLKALGVFPIKRGTSDIAAIKMTLGLIKDGNNICLYPQGTRCPGVDPATTEVKTGVAMLLNHSGGKILPVAMYTKNYKIKLFSRVFVIIGEPKAREYYNFADNSREEYQRVSEEIFADICSMLKRAENGEYGR